MKACVLRTRNTQTPCAPSLDRRFRSVPRGGARHQFRPSISDAAPPRKRDVIIPMSRMVHVEPHGLSNADATTSIDYRRPGPMPRPQTKPKETEHEQAHHDD